MVLVCHRQALRHGELLLLRACLKVVGQPVGEGAHPATRGPRQEAHVLHKPHQVGRRHATQDVRAEGAGSDWLAAQRGLAWKAAAAVGHCGPVGAQGPAGRRGQLLWWGGRCGAGLLGGSRKQGAGR